MKCLLVIVAFVAVVAEKPLKPYQPDDRFFYFARDDNDDEDLLLIDSLEPVDENFVQHVSANAVELNSYFLYTRQNPTTSQILVFGDAHRLAGSNFDCKKNTVFLVDGWNSDRNGRMSRSLRDVFLEDGNVNVIVLDWSYLSKQGYFTAVRGVPSVGHALGIFISWIIAMNSACSYNRIHLVGFSLGAHIVGNAGRQTNSNIQRITALDPAGPAWQNNPNRIMASNAKYVEVIHTNIDILGYRYSCGNTDFYPNGGVTMPGCITNSCSHYKAIEYFVASIRYNRMRANECPSIREATALLNWLWRCGSTTKLMGNSDIMKSGTGIFRLSTRATYPYV